MCGVPSLFALEELMAENKLIVKKNYCPADLFIATVPGLPDRPVGVFSVNFIKKGQFVGYLVGEIKEMDKLEKLMKRYVTPVSKSFCLDYNTVSNWARLLNGSLKYPNVAGSQEIHLDIYDGHVYFPLVATKNIEPGEQILLRYHDKSASCYIEMGV